MLRSIDDIDEGRVVFLYANTKQASRNCYRQLTVKVLSKKHWPMITVGWTEDGVDLWELVHKDNIRLRKPSARVKKDEREGDTVRDGKQPGAWAKARRMPGRVVEVEMPPDVEQGTLF